MALWKLLSNQKGKLYINILDVSLEKLIFKVHFNVCNKNHRRGYQLDADGEWEEVQGGYLEGAEERKWGSDVILFQLKAY